MGFLQAESKRNFYTKDFIKIGLQTALTGGPDLGRVAFFFFFHFTFSTRKVQGNPVQFDGFKGFGDPKRWHAGRKDIFH